MMKALIVEEDRSVKVQEIPKPAIDEDQILVKVVVVGQNPTDWKSAQYLAEPGVISGVDFAGVVEELGANVKDLKVGDRVSGMVPGAFFRDEGAFAEYLKTRADLVYRVPDSVSLEQAATVPCPCFTACQALFRRLGLPEPGSAPSGKPVLIWAGSTSVGIYAVQLAKLAGLKVFTTASKQNHDFLKSLGADFVADYRDADVVDQIKKASGDAIESCLDCISEGGSTRQAADCLSSSRGGRVITLLPGDAADVRKDVKVELTVIYTAFGRAFQSGKLPVPKSDEDKAHHVRMLTMVSSLLAEGKLKTVPIKQMPGGLEGIQAGFEYMKAGKVHAEKLVYTL